MFRWVPYPFLRLTPAFIAGILLNVFLDFQVAWWCLGIVLLTYIIITFLTPRKHYYKTAQLCGMLGITFLVLAGAMYTGQFTAINHQEHIANDTAETAYYTATVIEPSAEKKRSFQTTLSVEKILFSDTAKWENREGKVLLYQSKKESAKVVQLQYGDKIMIKGNPVKIAPPTNPGQFDYGKFLSFQNIYHQQFIKPGELIKYDNHVPNPFMAVAYTMQEKCTKILYQNISDAQNRGIALALILGVKDGLDNQIREAYAAAGAMHVLAVSGLHVGIIYLIISFLFSFTKKLPGGNWLHGILCLLFIWLYALVTGLSPSVMRAATMFSFIIVAEAARRQTNIYNTLAASAFFLLCIDPFLIVSVGFQLSYLAVAGIVYLQPKIYRWLSFDHWLPDKIWQLTAVSIAAQLATFPLGLYYFHQFPVYFWLANLLVIPAAFLILSGGLVVLLSGSLWEAGGIISGFLLEKLIWVTNQGVLWIEKLPFSIISNWMIDEQQTILLYAMIICVLLLFHYRRFKFLVYIFGCVCLFTWLDFERYARQNSRKNITFYDIYGESNVDFIDGKSSFLLGTVNEKTDYIVSQARIQNGLLPVGEMQTDENLLAEKDFKNLQIVVWQGKKVAFITHPFPKNGFLSKQIPIDYLVVCQDAVRDLEKIRKGFTFTTLVIDSSNRYYTVQNLLKQAESLGIKAHAVSEKGAYVVNFAHDSHRFF